MTQKKVLPRSIFRAYDIRGVVGDELTEEAYYRIAQALSLRLVHLNRKAVYAARDGRKTSLMLQKALIQGFLDSGIDVIDIGEVPTPVMYFATHQGNIDSGMMVTGSHNPSEYNGLKMVLAGNTLVQKDINLLYDVVHEDNFLTGSGHYTFKDFVPEYLEFIAKDVQLARPLKVVVDGGNGVSGPVILAMLQKLGCDVTPIYCDVDGDFPNHHPDPSVASNLSDLIAAVAKHSADIGIAMDGDGDRLGVVTDSGDIIWPDRLMMLFAKDVLSRNSKAKIVYDVKCSAHLKSVIEQADGIPFMCPTGHSIVKGIMKSEGAALAGEMSGHIFFKERWFGFDDALYSAARLLEIISRSPDKSSVQFSRIPNSVSTPELKIPVSEDKKFLIMEQFCREEKFPDATMVTIDGLRVEYPFGWGLLRASNTTPCLVARFEADSDAQLTYIKDIFREKMKAYGLVVDVF